MINFQVASRINVVLVFFNILVILCFVCVGYFHVEHSNWTDPPGFFSHGFSGVSILCLAAMINFMHLILYSNALAFVTRHLIGYRQKFATVYPAIYCRKLFNVINYVTFRWMTCGFMRLATLEFETKLERCIRMAITIFKILIWGGISSDIRSEITFYGSARASPQNKISDRISYSYPLVQNNGDVRL